MVRRRANNILFLLRDIIDSITSMHTTPVATIYSSIVNVDRMLVAVDCQVETSLEIGVMYAVFVSKSRLPPLYRTFA